ncbi:MAG: type II secretion system F family protein [Phycisphaerales bacterium]|nr:type II secretion system F family protein [Phycisphaerales bacterium]
MKYSYQAFTKAGKAASGVVDADTESAAAEQLRREGLFVSKLSVTAGGGGSGAGARARVKPGRNRLKNVSTFTRQLSVLVGTGTPVVDALQALENQVQDPAFKATISDVRRRLEEGSTFAVALEAHPRYFDAVNRSLVAAGESSGRLDVMLKRLAELTRQQLRTRNTLVGAMVYPALLIVVAVAVLILMMVFVLPRFSGLFTTLNVPLPPTTKALMAISTALTSYWYVALGGLIALVVGVKWYLGTDHGVRTVDTFLVRAPQLGKLTRSFATARISRLVGVLLDSKVQLLDALDLTREACSNSHYVELITRAKDEVTRGEPFSGALAAGGGLIHPSVCEAVRNGERTGQIGTVMLSMADFLDEENEVILKSVTSLLEPLILIVLGAVVGLVATSMFMPLFDLTAMAGPGGGGGGQ